MDCSAVGFDATNGIPIGFLILKNDHASDYLLVGDVNYQYFKLAPKKMMPIFVDNITKVYVKAPTDADHPYSWLAYGAGKDSNVYNWTTTS